MRIAIITDQYLPQLGGVTDSIVTQVSGLRTRGHTVRIYAPNLPNSEQEDQTVRLRTVTFASGSGNLVSPFGIKRLVREFKPDVVHVHSVGIAAFAGMQAARRLGVPVVATCHGSLADYLHLLRLNSAPLQRIVKRLEAWYFDGATLVTAPAQQPLDALIENGTHRPHMTVISNAIDFCVFRTTREKEELKKKLGIGRRAVMLFGRVAAEKNLDFALEILADVRTQLDIQIVVLGDGPYRSHFEEKLQKLSLVEYTRMLGVLRDGALSEAISACDIMLTTSLNEAQPMTILQAASCGIPVVGARAGGVPECIQDGVTGCIVDPDDKAAFARQVLELLTNDVLRKNMSEAAKRFVSLYSPDHVGQLFVDAYQKAIELHGR